MKNIFFIFFFGVMLGPYIKSRGTHGTRGTELSANAALIKMETYIDVQQGETNLKTSF